MNYYNYYNLNSSVKNIYRYNNKIYEVNNYLEIYFTYNIFYSLDLITRIFNQFYYLFILRKNNNQLKKLSLNINNKNNRLNKRIIY